jgi:hypothetical protein
VFLALGVLINKQVAWVLFGIALTVIVLVALAGFLYGEQNGLAAGATRGPVVAANLARRVTALFERRRPSRRTPDGVRFARRTAHAGRARSEGAADGSTSQAHRLAARTAPLRKPPAAQAAAEQLLTYTGCQRWVRLRSPVRVQPWVGSLVQRRITM